MTAPNDATVDRIPSDSTDSHLRSTKAVTGYHIEATDGELGHLDGFVIDDQAWAIRYIEVATKNWWPGKKVLVSPAWIQQVSWDDSTVYVGLSREAIQSARSSSTSRRSRESTKTDSTLITADHHIGCAKPNTRLLYP